MKKYYDYTSKYGIGYLLNNGFYGVYFNDRSKIIFNSETNIFFYIEQKDNKEIITTFNMEDYPK